MEAPRCRRRGWQGRPPRLRASGTCRQNEDWGWILNEALDFASHAPVEPASGHPRFPGSWPALGPQSKPPAGQAEGSKASVHLVPLGQYPFICWPRVLRVLGSASQVRWEVAVQSSSEASFELTLGLAGALPCSCRTNRGTHPRLAARGSLCTAGPAALSIFAFKAHDLPIWWCRTIIPAAREARGCKFQGASAT